MNFENFTLRTGASLLDTLTSALYADPIVVFREYVQNAVDSFTSSRKPLEASRIEIRIEEKENRITVWDNGPGIPSEQFIECMTSLGDSTKYGNHKNVGFRGIGRLAGLSFCEKLYFINKSNAEKPQFFSLSGRDYRKILEEKERGTQSLQDVLKDITSDDQPDYWVNDGKGGFEVLMCGVKEELWGCIHKEKRKINSDRETVVLKPSNAFIKELSLLLPVPYHDNFSFSRRIKDDYQQYLQQDLSQREFDIRLNGDKLFKPFKDIDNTDFLIQPIRIFPNADSESSIVIGVLWLNFYYVFKAMKDNWGIAVRSKNILVNSGAIVAEEAANDFNAVTSFGQYLSALKGVSGELLLDTNLLSDNSRRDWFRMERTSLQLRSQLCQLMNRIHSYRYKISQYVHKKHKTQEDKDIVIKAYEALVVLEKQENKNCHIENFIQQQLKKEDEYIVDERADERDVMSDLYSSAQRRFYKQIMLYIYEYFGTSSKDITDYYKLKSFVVKKLNRESESESTNSEVSNA